MITQMGFGGFLYLIFRLFSTSNSGEKSRVTHPILRGLRSPIINQQGFEKHCSVVHHVAETVYDSSAVHCKHLEKAICIHIHVYVYVYIYKWGIPQVTSILMEINQ